VLVLLMGVKYTIQMVSGVMIEHLNGVLHKSLPSVILTLQLLKLCFFNSLCTYTYTKVWPRNKGQMLDRITSLCFAHARGFCLMFAY
jgi:hypothetical protein